jgi:hypothetical protein
MMGTKGNGSAVPSSPTTRRRWTSCEGTGRSGETGQERGRRDAFSITIVIVGGALYLTEKWAAPQPLADLRDFFSTEGIAPCRLPYLEWLNEHDCRRAPSQRK